MSDQSKSQIPQELPGDWEDVSENTGFQYHWHRNPDGGDYPSIRMTDRGSGSLSGLFSEAVVGMYPSPEGDDGQILRTTHETREDAIDRVLELMEEYPHDK